MSTHRLLLPGVDIAAGSVVEVSGDEARHAARSKRQAVGDAVEILDGAGVIAAGVVESIDRTGRRGDWVMRLRVAGAVHHEPTRPAVEVWSACPKGPRLEEMIDQLSQIGASAWRPLVTDRGVVDPRPGKLDRLARVAAEAAKQCSRAHLMRIGAETPFAEAIAGAPRDAAPGGPAGPRIVLADARGGPYRPDGSAAVRLLVGPEGDWTEGERASARAAGVEAVGLGPHVMRVGTAAVVGAAMILAAERDRSGAGRDTPGPGRGLG